MNTREAQRADLTEKIRKTFKAWRSQRPHSTFLRGLAVVEQRIGNGVHPERAVFDMIEEALDELEKHAPAHTRLLRQRWEGAGMGEVASDEYRSEANLFKKEGVAFEALADVVLHQEEKLRKARQKRLLRHLPPPSFTYLVGASAKISELLPHLKNHDAPWLIALVGMGGIGKTSLCRALVEKLIQSGEFEEVAWVSAQQVLMSLDGTMEMVSDKPALTQESLVAELGWQLMGEQPHKWRVPAFEKAADVKEHLFSTRCLVVVDNLETVPDLHRLLPFLRGVRGSSKFILTSRENIMRDGDIFNYPVPLLTEDETLALIEQEAAYRNIAALANCEPATAKLVFDVTGGNPLAIRLVVGQIHLYGLSSVLDDLRHPRGIGVSLHRYLYDWVWDTLSVEDRTILNALLTLTDDNSTATAIQQRTDLTQEQIRLSLLRLVTQNLVILQGDIEKPRYTLHNLTRAFLEEINRNNGTRPLSSSGTS